MVTRRRRPKGCYEQRLRWNVKVPAAARELDRAFIAALANEKDAEVVTLGVSCSEPSNEVASISRSPRSRQ
jgi:hypothetical protein